MIRHVKAQHRILQYIAEHNLKPGDRLPSERKLAQLCEVSHLTLRRSLEELRKNDLIESRHGLGSFVRMDLDPNSETGRLLFLSLGETYSLNDYRFFATFKDIAGRAGFLTEYCKPGTDRPQPDFLKNLEIFSGVIVYGYMLEAWLDLIRGASCPVVLVPNREADFNLPAVNLDVAQGTRLVIHLLLQRGIRRFFFPFKPKADSWSDVTEVAAHEELRRHGIPETDIKTFGMTECDADFYRTLRQHLLPYRKETAAVMVYNPRTYIVLSNMLLEEPELAEFQIGFCSQTLEMDFFRGIHLKRSVIVATPPDEPWKTAFSMLMNGSDSGLHKIAFSLISEVNEQPGDME